MQHPQGEEHECRLDGRGREVHDGSEDDQAAQHDVGAQEVPAGGELPAKSGRAVVAHDAALGAERSRQGQHEDGRRRERQRIDRERRPRRDREEQAADRGAHQLLGRRFARDEAAIGAFELTNGHDVRQQGRRRRIEERFARGEDEDHQEHQADRGRVDGHEHGEQRDDDGPRRIDADHQALAVVPVGDDAGEDPEEQERQPPSDLGAGDEDRRIGQLDREQGEGHERNAVAEVGDRRREPERPETPTELWRSGHDS